MITHCFTIGSEEGIVETQFKAGESEAQEAQDLSLAFKVGVSLVPLTCGTHINSR